MIKSEKIAIKINVKIQSWVNDHAKLVVAIDGYAGSGKTTIADLIAKQNSNVTVIHLDDFIKRLKIRKKMMENASDKSKIFEYSWYHYDDLKKLIGNFKTKNKGKLNFKIYNYNKNDFSFKKSIDLSKKILVIEGIFLFHPDHDISRLWDKTVYLDIDFTKADKKRVAREKKKWGKKYIPENNPDNWTKYYKTAYRNYIKKYNPQKNSDVTYSV